VLVRDLFSMRYALLCLQAYVNSFQGRPFVRYECKGGERHIVAGGNPYFGLGVRFSGYGYLLCSRMAKIYADDFTFVKFRNMNLSRCGSQFADFERMSDSMMRNFIKTVSFLGVLLAVVCSARAQKPAYDGWSLLAPLPAF
jgi:hypothetical protein